MSEKNMVRSNEDMFSTIAMFASVLGPKVEYSWAANLLSFWGPTPRKRIPVAALAFKRDLVDQVTFFVKSDVLKTPPLVDRLIRHCNRHDIKWISLETSGAVI